MIHRISTKASYWVLALLLLGGCGGGGGNGASVLSGNSGGSVPSGNSGGSVLSGNSGGSVPSGNSGGSVPSGNATFQRVAKLILKPGEASLYSGVIDPTHGYGYFGTSGSVHPGYIIKVALGAANAAPVEVGALHVPLGQEGLITAVIDTTHGYAYFGNLNSPGMILKVALGAGNAPPRLVGSLILNPGESLSFGAALDPVNEYAYFSLGNRIVKIALGSGDALPTRVGAIDLDPGLGGASSVLLDPVHGYLYALCGALASSNAFLKFTPGVGNAPPTRVGSMTLPAGEDHLWFAALDPDAGYAYLASYFAPGGVGDDTTPGKIVKVRLNSGDTNPTRIGALTVPQKYFTAGGIDPRTHYLYLSNDLTFPVSTVSQIATGAGDALPTLVNTLSLAPGSQPYTYATRPHPAAPQLAGEIYVRSGGIDAGAGYLYFGTDTHSGQVIKIGIPPK